jgi:hypothetical protein
MKRPVYINTDISKHHNMNTIKISVHVFMACTGTILLLHYIYHIIKIEFGIRFVIFLALKQLIQDKWSL